MTKIVTDGLVIKETNIGEADRLITVITKDNGIIKAYASGVKSIKSKRASGTGLLSYSNFCLSKTGENYRVSEATPIKLFFGTGGDIIELSIASYFCELCSVFVPSGDSQEEFLRIILNSLYFLTEKKKTPFFIKAVTELRIAVISGYCPDLVACGNCGKYEDETMFFNISSGSILCKDCNKNVSDIPLDKTLLSAMRHIVYSPFNRLYNFNIPDEYAEKLSDITEKYIVFETQYNFKTLSFLNSIRQEK